MSFHTVTVASLSNKAGSFTFVCFSTLMVEHLTFSYKRSNSAPRVGLGGQQSFTSDLLLFYTAVIDKSKEKHLNEHF